jgi:hypothetical protein
MTREDVKLFLWFFLLFGWLDVMLHMKDEPEEDQKTPLT